MTASLRALALPCGTIVAAAVLVPWATGTYWTITTTSAVLFAIAALGVAILYGHLGLSSLCQIALMGVGGWTMLRLGYATDLPFLVLVLLSALITAVVGAVVGSPALRLSGLHLALLTLMAAAAAQVAFSAAGFPNGGTGFLGQGATAHEPLARPGFATSDAAYLRLCAVVAIVCFVVVAGHIRFRPGRAWAVISQSEPAALACGVNTSLYKLWGFALSGFLAGIAGGLLAGSIGTLDVSLFPASSSIVIFAVVLVSGAYGLSGAIIAAAFAKVLPAALDRLGVDGNVALLLFGIGVIQTLAVAPQGIAGMVSDAVARRRWRSRNDKTRTASSPTEVAP